MLRWMIWNQTEAFQWWCRNWHAAMSNRTRGMFLPLSCPWEGSSSQQYIVVLFPSNCKFIRMASIKRSSSLKQREKESVRARFSLLCLSLQHAFYPFWAQTLTESDLQMGLLFFGCYRRLHVASLPRSLLRETPMQPCLSMFESKNGGCSRWAVIKQ